MSTLTLKPRGSRASGQMDVDHGHGMVDGAPPTAAESNGMEVDGAALAAVASGEHASALFSLEEYETTVRVLTALGPHTQGWSPTPHRPPRLAPFIHVHPISHPSVHSCFPRCAVYILPWWLPLRFRGVVPLGVLLVPLDLQRPSCPRCHRVRHGVHPHRWAPPLIRHAHAHHSTHPLRALVGRNLQRAVVSGAAEVDAPVYRAPHVAVPQGSTPWKDGSGARE
jgi:hypothetical protein